MELRDSNLTSTPVPKGLAQEHLWLTSCMRVEAVTGKMALSLTQQKILNELGQQIYRFVPGKAHPYADQRVSFEGVAASLRLDQFWPSGSKRPAIIQLLSSTLEHRSEQFCPLIVEVVRKGMTYCDNRGELIRREEITRINDLVAKIGFKIPELWDRQFIAGLPGAQVTEEDGENDTPSETELEDINRELLDLASLAPVERGFKFEKFLGRLFEVFGLEPRSPFRLVGEQIDGSFQLQGETYLVEATWRNERIGQEELLAFSGKVAGKAQWSRGLLISYSGFSENGLEAFARGKPTNVVCVDGLDLHDILGRKLNLRDALEQKVRKAAETNQAHVAVRSLF